MFDPDFVKALLLLTCPVWLVALYHSSLYLRDFARFATLSDWKKVRPARVPPADPAPAMAELRAQPKPWRKKDWERLLAVADELCDSFRSADQAARQAIHLEAARQLPMLFRYANLAVYKLRQKLPQDDAELVFRRAVAALLIDGDRGDWRDVASVLNDLHSAARKRRLDFPKLAAEVEALEGMRGGFRIGAFLLRLAEGK